MTGALATHYAHALAEAVFAKDSGLTPEIAVEQMRSVDQLISGSPELKIALLSPAINRQRKSAVLSKLGAELGLHRLIQNFLLVIVSHRRTKDLHDMRLEFEAAVDERLGWVPAEITSAAELNGQERKEIEQSLRTKLGKLIRPHYQVDPNLLAGVRARVASKEYDATLRGKLESMRERLGAGR